MTQKRRGEGAGAQAGEHRKQDNYTPPNPHQHGDEICAGVHADERCTTEGCDLWPRVGHVQCQLHLPKLNLWPPGSVEYEAFRAAGHVDAI